MSRKTKKVSIVIVNYNGERFIPRLFETLCEQTCRAFEVVFVDNASTDHSLVLLENLLKKETYDDLNVKIVRNAANLGFCQGNNVGLKHVNGKYVVFLNNDTYVSATWLEELIEVMDVDSSVGVCQSRIIGAQTGGIQSDGWLLDIYGWAQGLIFNKKGTIISKMPFYASATSMIVRRSLLVKCGGFDPELFCGDYDLCWRLRLHRHNVAATTKSKCYHYTSVATKTIIPPIKLTFYSHQEIIRVLIKNYSAGKLMKRIFQSMALMFAQATYISLKYKNALHLAAFFKALIWNLGKLSDTLVARSRVQRCREVSDQEIEERMLHYPTLLMQLKASIR
jgi:GT2 family glycosyltransferase